jgi:hypothetical protein
LYSRPNGRRERRHASATERDGALPAAATASGIAGGHGRWHLASICRKTGTNRQAELVRLTLSLAMM